MAYEALYAVPSEQLEVAWLVENPRIISSFHASLLDKLWLQPPRLLTACALFGRICNIELSAGNFRAAIKQWPPYCTKADNEDIFGQVYHIVAEVRRRIARSLVVGNAWINVCELVSTHDLCNKPLCGVVAWVLCHQPVTFTKQACDADTLCILESLTHASQICYHGVLLRHRCLQHLRWVVEEGRWCVEMSRAMIHCSEALEHFPPKQQQVKSPVSEDFVFVSQ